MLVKGVYMKVTIKDVAKAANVATSTVSRGLSNNEKISDETKARVFEAIKKLNYKPNAIARSLANKKRHMLGVVLPNEAQDLISNHFFIEAMKGMSLYAQSMNYFITYAFSKDEDDESNYVEELCNSSLVDGICLLRAKEKDKTIEFLKEKEFPFVVIGRPEDTAETLWVDNDNFKASYDLNERIIKKGLKNIVFVGGRVQWNVTKDRYNGYKMAHEVNCVSFDENYVLIGEDCCENTGYRLISEFLKSGKKFDAVFTTDDLLAIGVLKKLNEEKIKNITVTGFNNIPLASYQNPPLASMDINAQELGYRATKLLIDSLEGIKNPNKHFIVNCDFIERESFY